MSEPARVKICGLARREDARAAEAAGADYLGVVLTAGFRRSVPASSAAVVVEGTSATRVAVLVDEEADGAQARAEAVGAGVVQLHGREPAELCAELGRRGPWRVWKAVRAREPADVLRAVDRYADVVDGLLLEGWREGVVGGGGAALDLHRMAEVRGAIPEHLTVILAGGLTPETVRAAAARFGPDVVDVSSGVEREAGRKDPDRMRRFVAEARAAGSPAAP